ncbi:undecaprenyl-diphosphatase [Kurthia huakuii]|uniref:undecaprenyl-diphosphatase n=1 Tax=Kurthia huakuii TaxID=1421019 RepID=UPI000495D46D|nr:undecaprenyl-diphosphatase [Kurthia huakuii]MBM7699314.1 undecaprenyl-diphosphatase [Kurthia huakuii]
MNYEVLKTINSLAGNGTTPLDQLMIFTTNAALYILAILLLSLFLFGNAYTKKTAIYAGIAGVCAILINVCIAQFYYEPRPFITYHDINVLVPHAADASFPSDHTAGAMGITFMLLLRHIKWGWLPVAFGLLTGFSRIYVGNHYPGDVLAGIAIGFIAAAVITQLRVIMEPLTTALVRIWYKLPLTGQP